jgi:hypothetical protein
VWMSCVDDGGAALRGGLGNPIPVGRKSQPIQNRTAGPNGWECRLLCPRAQSPLQEVGAQVGEAPTFGAGCDVQLVVRLEGDSDGDPDRSPFHHRDRFSVGLSHVSAWGKGGRM